MTETANTVFLHTRTQVRTPSGAGEKAVRFTCDITPATDSLLATEVNLKTIRKLFVQSRGIPGTFVWAFVRNPGSFNNTASLYVARGRVASGTITLANGGMLAGTHLVDGVAFGD